MAEKKNRPAAPSKPAQKPRSAGASRRADSKKAAPKKTASKKAAPRRAQPSSRAVPPSNMSAPGVSREEERRNHRAERQRQQRRRRRGFFVILIFIILVVGVVLSLTVFFNIGKIEVKGESIYSGEDIISASGLKMGDNLFLIKRTNVKNAICEKLPFIGNVEFKNSLPNQLIITVKDTSIKCAIEAEDGYVLLDKTGKVVAKTSSLEEVYAEEESIKEAAALAKENGEEAPAIVRKYVLGSEKVITLRGIEIESAVVGKKLEVKNQKSFDLYDEIMTSFEEYDISGITAMDLSDTTDVLLTYQDRIKIEVGSITNLKDKMALAANVIKSQDEISAYQEGTINLTIDKQAYFTPSVEEKTTAPTEEPTSEKAE